MRELTVYCCPDCGRYGFYQISRNAVCPICSRPMTALPVSYQIFMELDLEERSQLIAKQKERPAETAEGACKKPRSSGKSAPSRPAARVAPDTQAPDGKEPDTQDPGVQKAKTRRRNPEAAMRARTAAAGKPAPEPAIKPALRKPSLPSGNSCARKIRNCCARNASWSTPSPGCTT